MQDFLDSLEQRLSQLAAQETPAPKPARSPRNFRRRRPAILGGITAALAASAAAFTMTGTSLAELPILQTKTEDATRVAKATPQASGEGVDFAEAHPFRTPGGPGYVLVNEDTEALCVVVPDPDSPGDYGSNCSPAIVDVERNGLAVSLERPATSARAAARLTVVVLPEDAKSVFVESQGRRSKPTISEGVAVVELAAAGRLQWTVDGRRGGVELAAPFTSRSARVTCPDGSSRTIDPPTGGNDATSRERLRELVRAACRR